MSGAGSDLAVLAARLGHAFSDETLLARALTHPSAVAQGRRTDSYQRLEFLGDRVLGLAVASMLLQSFPKAAEGELSRRFNVLVRRETCAAVAAGLGVGEHLRLGDGEDASGGRAKTAILADAAEAIIAAIYLDGGWDAAYAFVKANWSALMRKPGGPLRDAKTALQEWAHTRSLPAPVYREVAREGPDHDPKFRIAVDIEGIEGAEGTGRSKRLAEQNAAKALLLREGVWTETAA